MAASIEHQVPIFAETNLGTHFVLCVPSDITAGSFKRELERAHVDFFPTSGHIQVHGVKVNRKSRFFYLSDSVLIIDVFHGMEKPWLVHVDAKALNDMCVPRSAQTWDNYGIRSFNYGGSTRPLSPEGSTTSRIDKHDGGTSAESNIARHPEPYLVGGLRPTSNKEKKKRSSKVDMKKKKKKKPVVVKASESKNNFVPKKHGSSNAFPLTREVFIANSASDLSSEALSVTDIINRYF